MNTDRYWIGILVGLIFLMSSRLEGQTFTEAWVRSDANGYPYGSMIAMDSQENVVVTGWRLNDYIITKKYDPDGNMLWERHFIVPDLQAVATWVLVDPSDNIVITGYPRTFSGSNPVEVGLLTIKYDSEGNFLWSDTYSGTWAFAVRGISDADGNIYVAGRAWFGTYDFVTIKYAPDGTRLWVDTFDQNSGFHTPNSMDLDSQGHLIINGSGMSGGFITVLYNPDGDRQWVVEQFGNTTSWVKLSGDGFFYLTGSVYNQPTSNDIWLLKYDLGGNLIWDRDYDFGVTSEYGRVLTLDSQGNVIISGIQGTYTHWITLKVDSEGDMLWSNVYNGNPGNDGWPTFILTGPDDEVYVTGVGGPPPPPCCQYRSMATLRYNPDGSNPWTAIYSATSQRGVGMALASDNSVYVAGDYMLTVIKYTQSGTGGGISCEDIFFFNAKCNANGAAQSMVKISGDHAGQTVTFDLDGSPQVVTLQSNGTNSIGKMTVPHAGMGSHTVTLVDPVSCYAPVTFNCQTDSPPDPEWDALWAGETIGSSGRVIPSETEIIGNYPNPFNPTTAIRYALNAKMSVSLKVYSVIGEEIATLVDEVQEEGYHEVMFNARDLASGTYFYRLVAGDVVEVRKLVIMK